MKETNIETFNHILTKVQFITSELNIKLRKDTGRPLAVSGEKIIALALFKHENGIVTKQKVWEIFKPRCSYKTLVVQMNKLSIYALYILKILMQINQKYSTIIKHTDSTDIPVCLNKNSKHHKIMNGLASYGYSGKGFYYGLKLSITTDLNRKLLNICFTGGNGNDRETFFKMNKNMLGIFIADSGYISKDLAKKFYIENQRILFAKPKANMKKIATNWQNMFYDTRMLIELNFRNLKMFHNLITSLPRSVDGYLANYVYSILAYVLV